MGVVFPVKVLGYEEWLALTPCQHEDNAQIYTISWDNLMLKLQSNIISYNIETPLHRNYKMNILKHINIPYQ